MDEKQIHQRTLVNVKLAIKEPQRVAEAHSCGGSIRFSNSRAAFGDPGCFDRLLITRYSNISERCLLRASTATLPLCGEAQGSRTAASATDENNL
jgi:hypothetical protein